MRVGFPGGPRLEWYDRNPQLTRLGYSNEGVAPHSYVIRATYTTPTGKKALITHFFMQLLRAIVATTLGMAKAEFKVAGNMQALLLFTDNTVGATEHESFGCQLLTAAGEAATIATEDDGEGGAVGYELAMSIIEFDT